MLKNNYIHTGSPNLNQAFTQNVFNITGTSLISLISALNSNSFGYDTLFRFDQNIRKFNDQYLGTSIKFRDSGGYSIIVGDVNPNDIGKFINCYVKHLQDSSDTFDYVFSLDIPFFIGQDNYNTVEYIERQNRESLSRTIEAIQDNPELKDKMLFVHQFKMHNQHAIWQRLYKELEIPKYFNHQAIGGMVGLIGFTKINFAPFLGPIFMTLYNYINNDERPDTMYVHLLGVYHGFSRFMIFFIQKLFNHYISEGKYGKECYISYDTINYFLSAQYKARDGALYFNYENQEMEAHTKVSSIPRHVLEDVYQSDNELQIVDENITAIQNGNKLTDVNYAVPMYIKSQLNLDDFYSDIIDKFKMVEIFTDAPNIRNLRNKFNPILTGLKGKYSFITSSFANQVMDSILISYQFHHWYMKDKTEAKLEDLLTRFNNKINFPVDLT
jgi:hypothetical protein